MVVGAEQKKQLTKEAMSINKSLSFLEQVVISLGTRKGHVPHRSSKLTAVLRESLGGNCKTTLVANVWPEARHSEETLSTLKFAARMQAVTTSAVVNATAELTPQAALSACQSQLSDLRRELAMHDQLAGRSHVTYDEFTPQQRAALRPQVQAYLDSAGPAELDASSLRQVHETYAMFKLLYNELAAQLKDANERLGALRAAQANGARGGPLHLSAETDDQPNVEVVLVGDVDGGGGGGSGGFAAGEAPPDAKPDSMEFAQGMLSARAPAPSSPSPAAAPAASGARGGGAEAHIAEFKMTAGAELNALLLENKASLREKRAAQRKLAHEVNGAKREIDEVKEMLESKREAREGEDEAARGADVIDEEEFAWLNKLKACKARYRAAFEQLAEVRGEVEYMAGLVEGCRTQLVRDFEAWMREEHPEEDAPAALVSALGEPTPVGGFGGGFATGLGGGVGMGAAGFGAAIASPRSAVEESFDQDEQFDEMNTQMILSKDPDSLPFFKASRLAGRQLGGTNRAAGPRAKPKPFQ